MPPTRITVVLDVDHEPEVDVPLRAAQHLEKTLSDVEGFGAVSVVRGEVDNVVWIPQRNRGEVTSARHRAPSVALFVHPTKCRRPGFI